jgi:hypothetical protein
LLRSAKFVNVPNVLLAQNATNVELVAAVVTAIVEAATTIEVTIVVTAVEITASRIAVAEQSLLMENF